MKKMPKGLKHWLIVCGAVLGLVLIASREHIWIRQLGASTDGRVFRGRDKSLIYIDGLDTGWGLTIDLKKEVVMRPNVPLTTPLGVIFEDDGSGWTSGTESFDYRRQYHAEFGAMAITLYRPNGLPIWIAK